MWHGDSQIRQAAVDARPGTAPQRTSWAAWLWKLRRLVPGEVHLDLMSHLPRHPATGKVHRAELARAVAAPVRTESYATSRKLALLSLALAAASLGGCSALIPAMWTLASAFEASLDDQLLRSFRAQGEEGGSAPW